MEVEILEEGSPCDYCGKPIEFFDDDFAVCPNCGNEFYNMDYVGEFLGDRTDGISIELEEDL